MAQWCNYSQISVSPGITLSGCAASVHLSASALSLRIYMCERITDNDIDGATHVPIVWSALIYREFEEGSSVNFYNERPLSPELLL